MPAILLVGLSSFLVGFSLCFLHARYDTLPGIIALSVAGSVCVFVAAMIVHETFRQLAILGLSRLAGTDDVIKRRSAIPHVLGVVVLVTVSIVSNAYLWETGLASWHSRRCMQAEQYEDALAWANEFVRLAPESPDAYHSRAAVRLQLGDAQHALHDYVRAADVDRTRWDTVEVLLEKLVEYGTADSFWQVYDLIKAKHPEQAVQYLRDHSNLPERPPGVPSPTQPEPPGTEPHEPDESGQLVRRV